MLIVTKNDIPEVEARVKKAIEMSLNSSDVVLIQFNGRKAELDSMCSALGFEMFESSKNSKKLYGTDDDGREFSLQII